jgi:hypothetical protein
MVKKNAPESNGKHNAKRETSNDKVEKSTPKNK